MGTNYKEILQQVEQEKQKALKQESKNTDNPTSKQTSNNASMQVDNDEPLVNLCVRVPKSWRMKVKATAVSHDVSLNQLVVKAIDRYLEQENWLD